jgi:hypothetical protein
MKAGERERGKDSRKYYLTKSKVVYFFLVPFEQLRSQKISKTQALR